MYAKFNFEKTPAKLADNFLKIKELNVFLSIS